MGAHYNDRVGADLRKAFDAIESGANGLLPRWQSLLEKLDEQETYDSTTVPQVDDLIKYTEQQRLSNAEFLNQLLVRQQKLQAEDNQLLRSLTQYLWHKSLLRTFPTELLSRIFDLVVESRRITLGDRVVCDLLPVSQVCSRWRDIVHSNTEYWSHITWYSSFSDRKGVSLELLEMSLQLSNPRLLDIDFRARQYSADVAERALAIICQHSERWCNFDLSWHIAPAWPYSVWRSLKSVRGKLPELEMLLIDFQHESDWAKSSKNIDAFRKAPKLTSAWFSPYFPAPWNQLESLDIHQWKPRSLRRTLSASTNLISLNVTDFLNHSDQTFQPRIRNSSIVDLELCANIDPDWETIFFLNHVAFPSLMKLQISRTGFDENEDLPCDFDRVIAFIAASQCNLEHLSLIDVEISGADLLALFRTLPSLKTLELGESDSSGMLTNEVFNVLNVKLCRETILPDLTTLLIHTDVACFPRAAFLDAVVSRTPTIDEVNIPSVVRLETVEFVSDEGVLTDEDIELLQERLEDFVLREC